ncbi:hypothetical protein ACFU6I_07650 [Streptomyces sp. NPDC057486]|uniref:hypothetical protein n=1 Tax=Streptomyces sp. NPDC057486 TaxID=3346145 RepID=UPI0036CCB5D0
MGARSSRASRPRGTGVDGQATIERATGTRIGERQAIEPVQRAAADVDADALVPTPLPPKGVPD